MILLIIIFAALIAVIVAASKAVKALREENPGKAKTWGIIAIIIVLVTWILKLFYRMLFPSDDEDDEESRSYYILNEDYIFYESNLPKANFKKGDVVSGIVLKADAQTGTLITAAQSQAIQSDYLFIMSAKISIPLTRLRYPSDTELKEIEGDIAKKLKNKVK